MSSSPSPLTVGSLLDDRAGTRRSHPLLVCDGHTITYADAAQRSADLARGLLATGLALGSRVGLLYPNGPEFVVAALAAARIGAVAVPISTFSTAAEVRTLLRNAEVDTLLAAPRYRSHDFVLVLADAVAGFDPGDRKPLFSPSVPTLRRVAFDLPGIALEAGWTVESIIEAGNTISPDILRASQDRVSPSDRLVIVHTSGSTSEPKGVIHTHGSLVSHLRILNSLRRYDEEEILFSEFPLLLDRRIRICTAGDARGRGHPRVFELGGTVEGSRRDSSRTAPPWSTGSLSRSPISPTIRRSLDAT